MTINLVHEAMQDAINDTRLASGRLARDRRTAQRQVDALLDGGWRGVAADSFADAWGEWLEAADLVEAGLDAMADLLEAHQTDMIRQDEASQATLDAISARIIDRLG